MDRAEIHDLWTAPAPRDQQNKDRPAFVREHREAIAEHTDTGDPLPPPDASLARFSQWLDRYKGTVTRQLAGDDGDDADGASDKAGADEGGT
jgi:hypothetical protein